MNHGQQSFLTRWICTTIAVAVAVYLTDMTVTGWFPLVVTALVFGVINAVVRPILLLLSVPFIVVTLGLFILVLNAFLLWLAGGLVPGFIVGGFWNAFFGAIIVSIVNWMLSIFTKGSDGEYRILTQRGEVREVGMKQVQGRVVGDEK